MTQEEIREKLGLSPIEKKERCRIHRTSSIHLNSLSSYDCYRRSVEING
jgi:hypothetical protein